MTKRLCDKWDKQNAITKTDSSGIMLHSPIYLVYDTYADECTMTRLVLNTFIDEKGAAERAAVFLRTSLMTMCHVHFDV